MAVAQIVRKSFRPDGLAATPNVSTHVDTEGQWPKLSGTSADGLILVRPDGHVLWRCNNLAACVRPLSVFEQQNDEAVLQCVRDGLLHAFRVCLASA